MLFSVKRRRTVHNSFSMKYIRIIWKPPGFLYGIYYIVHCSFAQQADKW